MCGRAFALEGRGIWHALSVSAAQQVYGPVRARADMRFALESPPAAPSEDPGRATLEGAWKVCSPCIPVLNSSPKVPALSAIVEKTWNKDL